MVTVIAVVLVAAAIGMVLKIRRDRERAHGGDAVNLRVDIRLADQDTFEPTVVSLGVPAGKATRPTAAAQTMVIHTSWRDSPYDSGFFVLIALDGRVVPPRILEADNAWNANGTAVTHWARNYEVLAQRYEWLRGIVAASTADPPGLLTAAVGVPARKTGTVTAWFHSSGDGSIPWTDPNEVVVALCYLDDGEIRWVRRIVG